MIKIFLTYSYEDEKSANLLRAQLKGNPAFPIEITNDNMIMAESITEQIDNCIYESSIILSLVSNKISKNHIAELNTAVRLGKPIIGVLLTELKNKNMVEMYHELNAPIYDWTYQKVISLIHGKSKSIDYKLDDESIIEIPQIKIDFDEISYRITDHLIKNPEDIHKLGSRKYEEFIAFLLEKLGYEITLTKQTHDSGVDIYALKKNELGEFLTLIDCKKYSAKRPIGIGMVRTLYGTLNIKNASHGMIATTTNFSKDARKFEIEYKYQLSLKDHYDIYSWIKEVNRRKYRI